MRAVHGFNSGWLYAPEVVDLALSDEHFVPVTLPHTNKIFPYHNFDDAEYQFISTYRKRFHLPEPLQGRRLWLDFDGVLTACTVQLNGHTFAEYRGGFTPQRYDITEYVDEAGENFLTVLVDSRERKDIPPFGYTVDYMVFGGIYRDVQLRYVEAVSIENVHIRSHGLLTDAPSIEFVVHVRNDSDTPADVTVSAKMAFWTDEYVEGVVEAHGTGILTAWSSLKDMPKNARQLWSLENPKLYDFVVELSDTATVASANEVLHDRVTVCTGLREAGFADDGFYLNGERVKLIGLNRHQLFPYIGAAAPARLQRRDADILKYELGCNVVRTSHYPQSPHFLARCDEIGLLVFEEIPGWQFIGDEDWKELSLRDVRAMIERDWNHPSIIIWGVRINESWDNTEFYTRTNALARQLDPTRQTGGVRFFLGSEFLEDVYTLNDFSNGILEPEHTPHLVTEFNGHMFPTKTWDNEERRTEHALRHARVQSMQFSTGGVAGAIGWCAFDYNTHVEFGAGDRICYHGVMDIFRLPKFAAFFYESQQDPKQKVVLRPSTNWSLGDIKEGLIEPVIVFSNCEEIVVTIGGVLQGKYTPDHVRYPNLPHPPFTIENLDVRLAHPYGDIQFIGLIGGEKVADCAIASEKLPRKLALTLDDNTLYADGADMTRLVIRITDDYGNTLPYALSAVHLNIEGEAELIGANPFVLVGGQGAVYIKAKEQKGQVRISGQVERLAPAYAELSLT